MGRRFLPVRTDAARIALRKKVDAGGAGHNDAFSREFALAISDRFGVPCRAALAVATR
jgi:hypothetical protein